MQYEMHRHALSTGLNVKAITTMTPAKILFLFCVENCVAFVYSMCLALQTPVINSFHSFTALFPKHNTSSKVGTPEIHRSVIFKCCSMWLVFNMDYFMVVCSSNTRDVYLNLECSEVFYHRYCNTYCEGEVTEQHLEVASNSDLSFSDTVHFY